MRQRLYWNRDTKSWEPRYLRHLERIHVIPDEAEPFKSHADGQVYTSKSRYRADLRARGYEEVGNERLPNPEPPKMTDLTGDLYRTASERGLR